MRLKWRDLSSVKLSTLWAVIAILAVLTLAWSNSIITLMATSGPSKYHPVRSSEEMRVELFGSGEGFASGDDENLDLFDPSSGYETINTLMAERGRDMPMGSPPRSIDFIFHNKIPKSGSSTMKHLLKVLAPENNFGLDHVRVIASDWHQHSLLMKHVKKYQKKHPGLPHVMLKHHTFLNFSNFGFAQPTYINVVRNPVAQFASAYYFKRYGWELNGQERRGEEEDRDQTMDECVEQGRKECLDTLPVLSKYFCGTHEYCHGYRHPETMMQAVQQAKINIIRNYYAIGVLEHFDATLLLFEKMLPSIFRGATEAYHGQKVQEWVNLTRTNNPHPNQQKYSDSTRRAMERVLRYDMDLYNLCKALFYNQLAYYDIELG